MGRRLDNRPDGDLWIDVKDEPALSTHQSLRLGCLQQPALERPAALRAETVRVGIVVRVQLKVVFHWRRGPTPVAN